MAATRINIGPPSAAALAVPVGSLPRGAVASARRIVTDDSGELVFGQEEPLFIAMQLRAVLLCDGRPLSFWRMEAKVATAQRVPCAGEHLVVSEAPYGNGWTSVTRFKRGLKRARGPRLSLGASTLEQAQREIDALETDPWETGNYLTAGVNAPCAKTLRAPVRSYGRSAQWVLGVCADFEAHAEQLATCTRARRLLDDTHGARLRIVRPSPTSRAPVIARIHPKACEAAAETLLLSIRQALAGPDESGAVHTTRGDPWIGRPVMDLVDRLYRDHLYNQTRIHERRTRREVTYEE